MMINETTKAAPHVFVRRLTKEISLPVIPHIPSPSDPSKERQSTWLI